MPKTFPDHGPVQENAHENAERGFDTKADFIAGHPRNRKKPAHLTSVPAFSFPRRFLLHDTKTEEFVHIVKADVTDDPAKFLFSREVFAPLHKFPEIIAQDPSVHLMSGI